MPNLTAESAYALFTAKHPDATLKDAFEVAWQMATVRSPEASADETDATFRRNFGLLIRSMTVDDKGEITWMSIVCRGVEQGLYPRSDAAQAPRVAAADLDELRRATCAIKIVGQIDGHDVIRRGSALDIIEQRERHAVPVTPTVPMVVSYKLESDVDEEAQPDERAAFEECIRANCDPDRLDDRIARDGDYYVEYATALAWVAWQAARATVPQPTHYQQLLGVAYVVLGCLAANGVDIPVRFLDAFSDPDSVENPLELLPCDFLPAQAVRAAVEQTGPNGNAPFANCSFRHCDLPGQCKSEGACHHPARANLSTVSVDNSVHRLTDEQIVALWNECRVNGPFTVSAAALTFARAILAQGASQ